MVRLLAPLFSIDASGPLGRVLIYANRRRTPTVYRRPLPRNPSSAHQQARRLAFSWLASQWPGLPSPDQATWTPPAAPSAASRYARFMAYNLQRWSRNSYPTKTWPAEEQGSLPLAYLDSAQGYAGHAIVTWKCWPINDAWGHVFYRSQTPGFSPTSENAALIIANYGGGTLTVQDSPLSPGTYYYRIGSFTTDGNYYADHRQRSATVF